jgi:hypothetical protein
VFGNVVLCYLRNLFLFLSGNVDIVNGNLKLILGLIWSLIVRYQIGRSKFPPKKLMLAWLKVCIVINKQVFNSGNYYNLLLLLMLWDTLNTYEALN